MRTITSISAAAILLRGPEYRGIGVCNNLEMTGDELVEIAEIFDKFGWYSGCMAYPVEGDFAGYNEGEKWDGPRGERRRQLCEAIRDMSPHKDSALFDISARLVGILWHGPQNANYGVCVNAQSVVDLSDYADYTKFPGFTGDVTHPVELCEVFEMPGKWEGERGKRRMEFCRFLLSEFLARWRI